METQGLQKLVTLISFLLWLLTYGVSYRWLLLVHW